MSRFLRVLISIVTIAAFAAPLSAKLPERPFVLWNKQDIARMKKLVETNPIVRKAYEDRLAQDGRANDDQIFQLYRYAVMGDEKAGQEQKKHLLSTLRSTKPLGGAQWVNVVRYDLFYDKLTKDERAEIEKIFRDYIRQAIHTNAVLDGTEGFNDSRNFSRYDARLYSKSNWLPNIIWPRKVSANLMAAAMGDEGLIRETWGAYGSMQWYFDEYLADQGFYSEEFSKMGATPGAMLVYCRALERQGLNDLGYGYRGRHGATMRGHIESVIDLGYPRIELHSDYPQYPMLTIGDLRGSGSSRRKNHPSFAFQHSIVNGFLPSDEDGQINRWAAHGAWGGEKRGDNPQWDGYSGFTAKMQIPLWFEIAHQKWPEAGFGYFLAHMRTPGQKVAVPSLYFGLAPIRIEDVSPPSAWSYVAPQRGLVMLRHDESPAYWESPAPAVGFRLPSPYAHHCNDPMALAGYVAHNRHIYINRQATRGYARSWTRSVQSHCSVQVDKREPAFTYDFTQRHGFYQPVKCMVANSNAVYPGIDHTRAMFLTGEYLFDVTRLAAADGQPHTYTWFAHALGVTGGAGWGKPQKAPADLKAFAELRTRDTSDGWSVRIDQVCALEDESKAVLPDAWYERGIGVKVHMLGASGTAAHLARTPITDDPSDAPSEEQNPQAHEVGGTSLIVRRSSPHTTFAALHEPFEGGKLRIDVFEEIASTDEMIAVRIKGGADSAVDDRIMVQYPDRGGLLTVEAGDEQFSFADHAWIRISPKHIDAWGNLRLVKVKVSDPDTVFTLNGRVTQAAIEDGMLTFSTGRK